MTLASAPAGPAVIGQGMEWILCDLCGADDTEVVYRQGRFRKPLRNVICRRCALVYVNPRMAFDRYCTFYVEEYRDQYRKPRHTSPSFRLAERQRAEAIRSFLGPNVRPGARVLELGCRTGDLLHTFQIVWNCEVDGVEPDHALAAFASQTLGLRVLQGVPELADYPAETFDVVILCHVLEHCYAPTAFLERLCRMLKPSGVLYVEVPDVDQPYGSLRDYFQEAHPYSFSVRTLRQLAHKTGFAMTALEPYPPAMRARLRPQGAGSSAPLPAVDDYQLVLKRLHRYERYYWWTGQWLWGALQHCAAAGYRVLRRIGSTWLGDQRVQSVIDGAHRRA